MQDAEGFAILSPIQVGRAAAETLPPTCTFRHSRSCVMTTASATVGPCGRQAAVFFVALYPGHCDPLGMVNAVHEMEKTEVSS